jgi:DNA-binding transcriptional regulator GbsR (MarR family)
VIAPLPNDVAKIVETMSLVFEGFGFPRMAARIYGVMMVNDEEYATQAELVEMLQASTGSISTMVRLLEQLGFLERVSLPGERRDRFKLTSDPLEEMTVRRIEAAGRVADLFRSARESDEIGPKASARLARAEAFYRFFAEAMREGFDEWKAMEDSS